MKSIEIFTDGACRGNPGPGGWGALLRYGTHEKHLKGFVPHTTNNQMELLAAIEALRALTEPCVVRLTSDSQYLRQGITEWLPTWKKNHWMTQNRKTPVKNKAYWEQLDQLNQQHQITWLWVRGHTGHPENTLADLLANQAIDEHQSQEKIK